MRNKSFEGVAAIGALSAALLWTMPPQAAGHLTAEQVRAAVSGMPKDKIDLSNKDMSGDELTGLDLSGANLTRANLSGADLHGVKLVGSRPHGGGPDEGGLDRDLDHESQFQSRQAARRHAPSGHHL